MPGLFAGRLPVAPTGGTQPPTTNRPLPSIPFPGGGQSPAPPQPPQFPGGVKPPSNRGDCQQKCAQAIPQCFSGPECEAAKRAAFDRQRQCMENCTGGPEPGFGTIGGGQPLRFVEPPPIPPEFQNANRVMQAPSDLFSGNRPTLPTFDGPSFVAMGQQQQAPQQQQQQQQIDPQQLAQSLIPLLLSLFSGGVAGQQRPATPQMSALQQILAMLSGGGGQLRLR